MRVFVTGIGAVSCVGMGVASLETAMRTGISGVAEAGDDYPDLSPQAVVGMVRTIKNDAVPRADTFLALAIEEAFSSAMLGAIPQLPVYLGSAHGHLDVWQRKFRNGLPYSGSMWRLAQDFLEQRVGSVDVTVVSTACTASSVAFGLALDALRTGQCGMALVCGVESVTGFLHAGFASLRSLAVGNCRPFDRDRTGLVLGEGAAAIVLETEAHAAQRGANLLAEAAGFGFCADGVHLTAPDPTGGGASTALRRAIDDAQLDEIPGFINTHGTGTLLNDRMECLALKRVFGQTISTMPLTSTKPITGHMCGAAGAIEIVNSIIGMQNGFVPQILGLRNQDKDFADFDFVRDELRTGDFQSAISMNSGFGGTNTAVILKRAYP
ncbi:MAG: beta-ketoacyl-[acyl-carrier-protein] synthase family protein [Proteobacteria bacterium]|nr:beta-ketoacyl-[acyl-carrier-protein] synthase family protein [Desulfocapsa sp.]MBU4030522.1 beta-ketoacyl-[acyl-carrier-protein] synthase family protein [Pseudomonadota bacterium]MBU4044692.1 beta-ketoacyl-[acyl-carrier-protein] synthase family protein [Pseudomonadota bacterium]